MANVSIPWDTGERTIDLANIRLKQGQQTLSALGQLGQAAGGFVKDYRDQAAVDEAADVARKKELAVLAEEQQAQQNQPAIPPLAAPNAVTKDSVQPVNSSGQGNTNKIMPPTSTVDKQTPQEPQFTDERQVSSPGTGFIDVSSSQQPGGAKPTGGPTNPNTANPGPPPTAAETKPQPEGTAPSVDTTAPNIEKNAAVVKSTPQPGSANMAAEQGRLADLALDKQSGWSRFGHRLGDIFGVADPWRRELAGELAGKTGIDEEKEREAGLLAKLDTIAPKLVNAEPLYRHFAPLLTSGLPPGALATYPPNYGKQANLSMAQLQYMGSQKNPDGTWANPAAHEAVTRLAEEAAGRAEPQITKIINDINSANTPEERLDKIHYYQSAVQAGFFGHQPDAINAVLGAALRQQYGLSDGGIDWPGTTGGGLHPHRPVGHDPNPNAPIPTGTKFNPRDPLFKELETSHPLLGAHPGLLQGQVEQESNFDPTIPGHDGELGISQFMPDTGAEWGLAPGDRTDPVKSLHAQADFMEHLLRKHNGDVDGALREYNGGPGGQDSEAAHTYSRQVQIRVPRYANAPAGGPIHEVATHKPKKPMPSVTQGEHGKGKPLPQWAHPGTPSAEKPAAPKKKGPMPSVTTPDKTASLGGLPLDQGLISSSQVG